MTQSPQEQLDVLTDLLENQPILTRVLYSFTEDQRPGRSKPCLHKESAPDAIVVECALCKREQTFRLASKTTSPAHNPHGSYEPKNLWNLCYECAGCREFTRFYLVAGWPLEGREGVVEKFGQWPEWRQPSDPNMQKALGSHMDYLNKGLACEQRGDGLGALAYYRRVVEDSVDELLSLIESACGATHPEVGEAIASARKKNNASDRLNLIKEVLPGSLRPGGHNPIAILYGELSDGLHAQSEEENLERAVSIREVLSLLVSACLHAIADAKVMKRGITQIQSRQVKRKQRPKQK